jgi:hypothetical protein
MEWAGPSLHDLVRSGQTTIPDALAYVSQLADAVNYLHSGKDTAGMAVLHRDIKPGNVIISPTRGAVLVDFGLMRVEEPTLTELPAWTGPYLAPEAHADKTRTTRASDMWAVAATTFFALTGKQPSPFDTPGMREQLSSRLAGEVNDPARVVATLMDVLDRPPERRPPSPVSWATALLDHAGGPGSASPAEARDVDAAAYFPTIPTEEARPPLDTTPETAPPPKRRPSRSLRLSIGAALVALLAAAGVFTGVDLTGRTTTPSSSTTTAEIGSGNGSSGTFSWGQPLPGGDGNASVSDVAVGPDGSAWAIGTVPIGNVGYQILEWDGTKFSPSSGGAGVEIAAGPNKTAWVVNSDHQVYEWNGSSWGSPLAGTDGRTPASVSNVAVGPDGSAWAISTTPENGGYQILKWDGTKFAPDSGGVGAVEIAVGPRDTPWIVNSSNEVFEKKGSGWGKPLPGSNGNASVIDVAVGPDGSAWAIGAATAGNTGNQILKWNGTKFTQGPVGAGLEIAVGPNDTPWVVNRMYQVYQSS